MNKRIRITLAAGALAAVSAFGGASGAIAAYSFSDVERGDTHFRGVSFVSEQGWMHGKQGGRFDPNAPVTRGQLATVLEHIHGPQANVPANAR